MRGLENEKNHIRRNANVRRPMRGLEKIGVRGKSLWACSPPYARLRKEVALQLLDLVCSPPYARLRNIKKRIHLTIYRSPPYARLRKLCLIGYLKSLSSPPYARLRKS